VTRYWQHKDGHIAAFEDDEFINPERYTEVRVVPLDSVVIDGPLPEVTVDEVGSSIFAGASGSMVIRELAGESALVRAEGYLRDHAALVAYLREHPPVDEAQVKALAEDIRAEFDETVYYSPEEMAWRLVARWTKGGDPR